jgi:hypothetical protein
MLRHVVDGVFVAIVALLAVLPVTGTLAAPVSIPNDLEPWRAWVLQDQDYRRCPFVPSLPATQESSFRCAWPGRLVLGLDAQGGTFEQPWQVYAESWVRVPGTLEHWPRAVRVDGAPGAVVVREGYPTLRLAPGAHLVSGGLTWSVRPEILAIDPRTALIELTLDGKRVAQPERPDGALWLEKRRSAEQPQRMEAQVYRLVRDETPVELITLVRLQVSGDGREELLGRVLPEGFVPMILESPLPARLEPDGRLRVQLRAGTWEITLAARGSGVASRLARPTPGGAWTQEEVWSFAGEDRLRVAAAEGVEGIDPVQANVPDDWRGYPAFRMAPDSVLTIVERTRGLENADDNHLTLNRRLWLDFDHGGITAVDHIGGTMRRDWRLSMAPPFNLQSARIGESALLVTRNGGGAGAGVEIRTPQLDLTTTARAARSHGELPATGWNTRFDTASGELNLPPGHRLLAALGTDHAPDAWLESWGLWGLFGVLVIAVFAGWLGGWQIGAIALVGLLLTYQESPEYIWLWANVLAAAALARAAPEGRLRRFAARYRVLSFIVLGFALLPLLWSQVRLALYPQLEPMFEYGVVHFQTTAAEAPAPATARVEAAATRESKALTPDNPYALQSVIVTGSRANIDQRYAPGTLLQTGPGVPAWRYHVYSFGWSGPVEAAQTVRFVYIGPVLLGLWRVAGAALLALLFLGLLGRGGRKPDGWSPFARWFDRGRAAPAGVAVIGFMLASIIAPAAHAASTPDGALLEQLKARLTRPPECVPTCAEVMSARVDVRSDQLDVSLDLSALTSAAVGIPTANDHWQLDSVTVDGRSTPTVAREGDGSMLIPLAPGAHTIHLGGRLAPAQSIQLAFPSLPRRISVNSDGWDVAGVNEEHLLSGSLELVRRRTSTGIGGPLESASEFPSFVRVSRRVTLGLDWRVETRVERIAPAKASLSLQVPLLTGESVLSEGLETSSNTVGERVALVGLERGQDDAVWESALARSETLDLELPASVGRAEVWSFVASPQWNLTFEGFPAVLSEDSGGGAWVYEFHPRPGEKLRVRITRPQPAEGATLAIDSVAQNVVLGKRSSDTSLTFNYRSTQGGRHTINLPDSARVTAVKIGGAPVPLRPDKHELSIGLLPGSHSVTVEWTTPAGVSLISRVPAVGLRAPASNVRTTMSIPSDRWTLFAAGPGVGPAVLYWGELLIFLITAFLLGRWPCSPLKVHEWLLLGLGLSTLSWFVLALVAAWLFALRWREGWQADVSRWRFNLVQVALALLTVLAVGALVFSGIRQSLLASPDMGVAGPDSWSGTFVWFLDQTVSALPRPTVFSVPMWVYRALMFAWALWIVLALLRWLRWAWNAWKVNGIWRGKGVTVAASP